MTQGSCSSTAWGQILKDFGVIPPEDLKSVRSQCKAQASCGHTAPVVPSNMGDWIGTDRFGVIFQGLLSLPQFYSTVLI